MTGNRKSRGDASPLSQRLSDDWSPKLKQYPHFDAPISPARIKKLVSNPKAVAENSFFPFIEEAIFWQPFRNPKNKKRPSKKFRPIMYASRRDSYIFSYYRSILMEKYERELEARGLEDTVIAYRSIPLSDGVDSGKNNIHFAHDAIKTIREMRDCVTVTLDIKNFFGSIEHQYLKNKIEQLLGQKLSPDWEAIFKAMTKYRYVRYQDLCERLGYFGEAKKYGKTIKKFLIPRSEMPTQLCDLKTFRKKIVGKGRYYKSIIKKNYKKRGIPQGSPISDVFANLYLVDFDESMNTYANKLGGVYRRYSDDILFIIPGTVEDAFEIQKLTINEIKKYGNNLRINSNKTAIVSFIDGDDGQNYVHHELGHVGETKFNGLEYLGFRYDGKRIYLRDKSISNHYRKVTRNAWRAAWQYYERNPTHSFEEALQKFNYRDFITKFDRVPMHKVAQGPSGWTYWTYILKCYDVFGDMDGGIRGQMKGHKRKIKNIVIDRLKKVREKINSYN